MTCSPVAPLLFVIVEEGVQSVVVVLPLVVSCPGGAHLKQQEHVGQDEPPELWSEDRGR